MGRVKTGKNGKMKIGTITFHGAYNYGSVLQAYALQEFILSIGRRTGTDIDYQIINYRPQCQKEIYWQAPPAFSVATQVKRLMRLRYGELLRKQAMAYEKFIGDILHTTDEYSEVELSRHTAEYDFYLSGSDQVFNIRSLDFTFPNLLNFTDNPNKISYAASLGPLEIDWTKYDKDTYIDCLRKFKHLSLREQRSKDMVDNLLKTDTSEVHIDPTLLLSADDWRQIQSERNYNNGKYILLYCLEPSKQHLAIAEELSNATGLPIVSTGYRNKHDYFNNFVKLYDAGPTDFLSLIDHAALVLTSSFHGTAFSVIYDKKFWVIDGMEDNRIRSLLSLTGLEQNNIPLNQSVDFSNQQPLCASSVNAYAAIENERKRSREYLQKALNIL